jgi:hypothetical protein
MMEPVRGLRPCNSNNGKNPIRWFGVRRLGRMMSASSVPMPSAAAAAKIYRSILNPIFNLT